MILISHFQRLIRPNFCLTALFILGIVLAQKSLAQDQSKKLETQAWVTATMCSAKARSPC